VHFGIPDWAVGVGFIIIAASLAKALIRIAFPGERLSRDPRSPRDIARTVTDLPERLAELDDLRQRLGEVDDLQRRLAEVEERLDFAERLLTKQRDADRLASPQP
jgi:predicted nuclease with TOPRIM domain